MDSLAKEADMSGTRFYKPFKDEKGQGLTEYALILMFMTGLAVAGLTAFAGGVGSLYAGIMTSWP